MEWPSKKMIYGCDARGDGNSLYLARYTLIDRPGWKLNVHVFHRSDADDLHDHPWPFVSLILWRGYIEHTPQGRRRQWPGMLLFRRAGHAHRVELVDGKPAVTLVLVGKRHREWGFFTPAGWVEWTRYFREKGC